MQGEGMQCSPPARGRARVMSQCAHGRGKNRMSLVDATCLPCASVACQWHRPNGGSEAAACGASISEGRVMLGGAWAPKDPTGSVVCGVPLVIKGSKSLDY